jgi:putative addiction module antidote
LARVIDHRGRPTRPGARRPLYSDGYDARPRYRHEDQDHHRRQFRRHRLPKELLARLRIGKGDELYANELPDGIKLSPFDPALAEQMEVAERIMRKRRSLLRKLAKGVES